MLKFRQTVARAVIVLCVCASGAVAGPERPNFAALRVSVIANVAQGCGASISPTAIQQLAAGRLAGSGITVSSIHNAQLAVDLDCIAMARNIAVHQCLNLSELVTTMSHDGKATLASTWRSCHSYECPRGKCEVAMRHETGLLDELLGDFNRRSPPAPIQTRAAAPAIVNDLASNRAPLRLAFYLAYILACLSLLLHWQTRKQTD